MLSLVDGTLVLAATDLTNHLACAHLTQQRLGIVRRERAKPRPADDPHAEHHRTGPQLVSFRYRAGDALNSFDRARRLFQHASTPLSARAMIDVAHTLSAHR